MTDENILIIIILSILWTLPWKAVALWKAAQQNRKIWFVLMLAVNTLAILEILYIFVFSRKSKIEEPILKKEIMIKS
jgi:preprotein translocase subunit SecY